MRGLIIGAAIAICSTAAMAADGDKVLNPDELDRVTAGFLGGSGSAAAYGFIQEIGFNLGENGNYGFDNRGQNHIGLFNRGNGSTGVDNRGSDNLGAFLRGSGNIGVGDLTLDLLQ